MQFVLFVSSLTIEVISCWCFTEEAAHFARQSWNIYLSAEEPTVEIDQARRRPWFFLSAHTHRERKTSCAPPDVQNGCLLLHVRTRLKVYIHFLSIIHAARAILQTALTRDCEFPLAKPIYCKRELNRCRRNSKASGWSSGLLYKRNPLCHYLLWEL
jgi:hypothetical protein